MEISQRASGSETRPWTQEEDQKLIECMNKWKTECQTKNRPLSWIEIAGQTVLARSMDPRSRWTEEEDQRLIESKLAGLNRKGKSCRERWKNHLDPNVKREKFSQEEDDSIICFQSLYGNSWASIAAHLPGRTDNDVKNRWYNHLNEKKLGRIGSCVVLQRAFIATHLPGRTDNAVKTRWNHHLKNKLIGRKIVNPWSSFQLAYPKLTIEPWISGPVSASVENAFMPTEQVTRNWSP
ncbi:hypothetical protein AAG906_016497 [Vitis piasezkii]